AVIDRLRAPPRPRRAAIPSSTTRLIAATCSVRSFFVHLRPFLTVPDTSPPAAPNRCPVILPRPGKYQQNSPAILRPPSASAIMEHMFDNDVAGSYDRDYGEGFDPGVCVMFETDTDWEMALLAAADVQLESLHLDDGPSDWWARGEAELGLVVACERQIAQVHAQLVLTF